MINIQLHGTKNCTQLDGLHQDCSTVRRTTTPFYRSERACRSISNSQQKIPQRDRKVSSRGLKAEDLKDRAMGRADNAGPNCRTLGTLKRMIYGPFEGGDSKRGSSPTKGRHSHFQRLPSPFSIHLPRFLLLQQGFLTHRIPSRDNVDDSSPSVVCTQGQGKADRLFPSSPLRANIILILAEILKRGGVDARAGRNRNPPIFNEFHFPKVNPRTVRRNRKLNLFKLCVASGRKRGYVCRGKELASDLPRVCSTI